MIIPPPRDDDEPEILDEVGVITREQWNYIEQRLLVKPWICPDCKLTNFGHNKKCADFKCRRPKP